MLVRKIFAVAGDCKGLTADPKCLVEWTSSCICIRLPALSLPQAKSNPRLLPEAFESTA